MAYVPQLPFNYPLVSEMDRIDARLEEGRDSEPELLQVLGLELAEWLAGAKRRLMLVGQSYYLNFSDIQKKHIEYEKETGNSNTKLEHAFCKKLVDQKIGYLLSKQPTIAADGAENANRALQDELNRIFDRDFLRNLALAGKDAVNKGISWLQVYIAEDNKLAFKKIRGEEVLPFWADEGHTRLDALLRCYPVEVYEGTDKREVMKVEFYRAGLGVAYYEYDEGVLRLDVERETRGEAVFAPDFVAAVETVDEKGNAIVVQQPYNWERVPFIPIKYNDEEQPLVGAVKSLVDNYNMQTSVNADVLADIPKFIYALTGYGGESDSLDDFLANLNRYKVILLDKDGAIDKVQAEPATDAVASEVAQTRRDIYEFGRGVDTQNENLGNASGVALRFRFADLDLDCNFFETEIQFAFEQMMWFVYRHIANMGGGDFGDVGVTLTLNRDVIISESEAIADCKNSVGIISNETIVKNHPWTQDALAEVEAMAREKQGALNGYADYDGMFLAHDTEEKDTGEA